MSVPTISIEVDCGNCGKTLALRGMQCTGCLDLARLRHEVTQLRHDNRESALVHIRLRAGLREALDLAEHGALYAYSDSTDRTPYDQTTEAIKIAELRALIP